MTLYIKVKFQTCQYHFPLIILDIFLPNEPPIFTFYNFVLLMITEKEGNGDARIHIYEIIRFYNC